MIEEEGAEETQGSDEPSESGREQAGEVAAELKEREDEIESGDEAAS